MSGFEIELVIDELKTHQRLSPQPLRSTSPELRSQELSGWLLAHYAVRAWMYQSAQQADLDPDHLSFTHALHVLDTACYEFALVEASDLPRLQERLLADLREPKTLPPVACASAPVSSNARLLPSIASTSGSSPSSGKAGLFAIFFFFEWHCPQAGQDEQADDFSIALTPRISS